MIDFVTVKLSGKMIWQQFHTCNSNYITTRCKGRCCESNKGIKVVVHPNEAERIKAYGVMLEDGYIKPDTRNLCPFKQDNGFCRIHNDKPLGCKASPFSVNDKGLIIIRNRYRLLCCYKDLPKVPAFEAHRWSLQQLFGINETDNITEQAKSHQDIIIAKMSYYNYTILLDNHIKRNKMNGEIKYGTVPMF